MCCPKLEKKIVRVAMDISEINEEIFVKQALSVR